MPKVFNNQVFIDFLAQLRPDEQHQYNSPWNIAAEFNIDMSCPHAFIRRKKSECSRQKWILRRSQKLWYKKRKIKEIKRALISELYSGIAEDIKALFMYKGSFG